jgi:hypothetical protein
MHFLALINECQKISKVLFNENFHFSIKKMHFLALINEC